MSKEKIVILNKGGSLEKKVAISQVDIPDLWHIAQALRGHSKVANGPACADLVLDCWHIANDLKRHIFESK